MTRLGAIILMMTTICGCAGGHSHHQSGASPGLDQHSVHGQRFL